jgi:competence protein ComEC
VTLLVLAAGWFLGAGLAAYAAAPWWSGALAAYAAAPWWSGALAAAAGAPWAASRWGRWGTVLALAAAGAALAGGLRVAAWQAEAPPELLAYRGQRITVEGTAEPDPGYGETTRRYTIRAERLVAPEDRPISGRLVAIVDQYTHFAPGERLRITGELRAPRSSPTFDYEGYLLERGIVGEMVRPRVERLGSREGAAWAIMAAEARAAIETALGAAVPEPEASLAAGILVGRDEGMGRELRERFRRSGLAHLVAVSGSNVALVTGAVFALLVPLAGRRRAVVPAAIAALAYAAAAGGDPSAIRATIMAGVFLAGLTIGRPQAGLPALALAAVAMTLAQPRLLNDVGFQLSCAATAGLIVWYPWADTLLARALAALRLEWAVPRSLRSIAALTLCATVATAPISWAAFGTVSFASLAANIIAQPLFVPAFALSAAAAAAALAWEPAGQALGLAAYVPLRAIVWTAELFGSQPWSAAELSPPGELATLGIVAGLVALGWWAARRRPLASEGRAPSRSQRTLRRAAIGGLAGAVCAGAAFTAADLAPGPGRLRVAFLDVGQGDAILVTTPNGYDLLVDCGPSGLVLLRELGAVLPPWDRTIDRLVVTHPQADHAGGCAAASGRYRIRDGAAWNGQPSTSDAWRALAGAVPPPTPLAAGASWSRDGVTFRVVWPPAEVDFEDPNDASIVLEISFGATRVLLTGDIESAAQAALTDSVGAVDVLKVPHHGSATSRSSFFAGTAPKVAVISVGEGNPYGHPAEATLRALARIGSAVYRTDAHGRVVVYSDGRRVWVETER